MQLEEDPRLWQADYGSFQSLVQKNHFCAWGDYLLFRDAEKSLGSELVDAIGYWAATRVVAVPVSARLHVAERLHRWLQTNPKLHPSYQLLDDWLERAFPKFFATPRRPNMLHRLREECDRLRRGYERVVAENHRLREQLRAARAR